MDLKLTSGDIDLTNGELSWVTGADAIRQDIEMHLAAWLNETVYDRSAGMPYIQVIFKRGINENVVRFIVTDQLMARPGVTDVLELLTTFDRESRELTITGTVRIDTGESVRFDAGTIT
jgi:hypothetical protein